MVFLKNGILSSDLVDGDLPLSHQLAGLRHHIPTACPCATKSSPAVIFSFGFFISFIKSFSA